MRHEKATVARCAVPLIRQQQGHLASDRDRRDYPTPPYVTLYTAADAMADVPSRYPVPRTPYRDTPRCVPRDINVPPQSVRYAVPRSGQVPRTVAGWLNMTQFPSRSRNNNNRSSKQQQESTAQRASRARRWGIRVYDSDAPPPRCLILHPCFTVFCALCTTVGYSERRAWERGGGPESRHGRPTDRQPSPRSPRHMPHAQRHAVSLQIPTRSHPRTAEQTPLPPPSPPPLPPSYASETPGGEAQAQAQAQAGGR